MNTNLWFYVDAQSNRQGPLTQDEISTLIRSDQIHADTLVWCEGMADWQPAQQHFDVGTSASTAQVPPAVPPTHGPVSSSTSSDKPKAAAEVVYAGFWRRWSAFVIDSILLTLVSYFIILILIFAVVIGAAADFSEDTLTMTFIGLWIPLWIVLYGGYYAGMESSKHQATLGKLALSIKVTSGDGGRIGFGHAVARWFLAALSYLTLYIGFMMAGFTEKKRALHDFIADTLVVDKYAFTSTPEKQLHGLHGCAISGIVIVLILGSIAAIGIIAAVALPAYQDYTARAQVSAAIEHMGAAREPIDAFYEQTGRCPRDAAEIDLEIGDGPYAGNVSINSLPDGSCVIYSQMNDVPPVTHPRVLGASLQMYRGEDGRWYCLSHDLESRHLPESCR